MKQIGIIIPTRDRPHNIERLHKHWFEMLDATVDTECIVTVERDNETVYPRLPGFRYLIIDASDKRGVTAPLNAAAIQLHEDYEYLGFWGDDHLPRTKGWNRAVYDCAQANWPYAMVYCNDGLVGERIPTEILMDSRYVRNLGYMAHPALQHYFTDDLWLFIGRLRKNIHYLPEILIEHLHYCNGKAVKDATYEALNSYWQDHHTYSQIIHDSNFIASINSLS